MRPWPPGPLKRCVCIQRGDHSVPKARQQRERRRLELRAATQQAKCQNLSPFEAPGPAAFAMQTSPQGVRAVRADFDMTRTVTGIATVRPFAAPKQVAIAMPTRNSDQIKVFW